MVVINLKPRNVGNTTLLSLSSIHPFSGRFRLTVSGWQDTDDFYQAFLWLSSHFFFKYVCACIRVCVYAHILDCEHAKQYHCVQRMLTLSLHSACMAPVLCFPQEHGNQDARPLGPSRPLVQLPLLSCLSCIPPYSSGTYQLAPVWGMSLPLSLSMSHSSALWTHSLPWCRLKVMSFSLYCFLQSIEFFFEIFLVG